MPLHPFTVPPILTVCLAQFNRPAATACVEVGQQVTAGQMLGRASAAGGLPAHSPTAGRVVGFVSADSARQTDLPAVQIEADQSQQSISSDLGWVCLPEVPGNLACSPAKLAMAADLAGLTDFRPGGQSLGEQLRESTQAGLAHLIVNGLPGEPGMSAGAIMLREHLQTVVRNVAWLGAALGAGRTWIAVDRADKILLSRIRQTSCHRQVRVAALTNKYPQHLPVLLALSIAGVEIPPGARVTQAGVVVLEVEAVLGLVSGVTWPGHVPAPMTHRTVVVSGPAARSPGAYRIPIGTRFLDVLRTVGLRHPPKRVVEGGPITGQAVAHLETVTTKETSALLVLDQTGQHVPAPGPCVRCGWCQEDCPVGLDPQALLDCSERRDLVGAATRFPAACIECGVCSYVCPTELPLAEGVSRLKESMRVKTN